MLIRYAPAMLRAFDSADDSCARTYETHVSQRATRFRLLRRFSLQHTNVVAITI